MNMNYRKKPVVIQAVKWDGNNFEDIVDLDFPRTGRVKLFNPDGNPTKLEITTLEGVIFASLGDFIIKGVAGELYPCKPDIFAATYDAV